MNIIFNQYFFISLGFFSFSRCGLLYDGNGIGKNDRPSACAALPAGRHGCLSQVVHQIPQRPFRLPVKRFAEQGFGGRGLSKSVCPFQKKYRSFRKCFGVQKLFVSQCPQ